MAAQGITTWEVTIQNRKFRLVAVTNGATEYVVEENKGADATGNPRWDYPDTIQPVIVAQLMILYKQAP